MGFRVFDKIHWPIHNIVYIDNHDQMQLARASFHAGANTTSLFYIAHIYVNN
jgi:hypothetical protein